MFYRWNEGRLSANCAVLPNPDVSGTGVRNAIKLQSILLILLSLTTPFSPQDLILSNLSIQITSASLIGAAILDPSIDVVHTLMASQFAVLLSACRTRSFELPGRWLRKRESVVIVSRLWCVDLVFRVLLIAFNLVVWMKVLELQKDTTICPDGFGKWALFYKAVDLATAERMARICLAYCIFDVVWELGRFVSHIGTTWALYANPNSETRVLEDPRFWILRKVARYSLTKLNVRSETIDHLFDISYKILPYITIIFRITLLITISMGVETTLAANNLDILENQWSFGQLVAMLNTAFLLIQVVLRFIRVFRASKPAILKKLAHMLVLVLGIGVFAVLYYLNWLWEASYISADCKNVSVLWMPFCWGFYYIYGISIKVVFIIFVVGFILKKIFEMAVKILRAVRWSWRKVCGYLPGRVVKIGGIGVQATMLPFKYALSLVDSVDTTDETN